MDLNDAQKYELLQIYHQSENSARKACEIFRLRHPELRTPCYSTLCSWHRKAQQTGLVTSSLRRPRKCSVTDADMVHNILTVVQGDDSVSCSDIARRFNISRSSAYKVLKNESLHPFKPIKVHRLDSMDFQRRMGFCQWLLEEESSVADLHSKILFTDESMFYLNGHANIHNLHHWRRENPHRQIETHSQYNPRVMVWCGIHNGNIVGPYFFEKNVNGKYIV